MLSVAYTDQFWCRYHHWLIDKAFYTFICPTEVLRNIPTQLSPSSSIQLSATCSVWRSDLMWQGEPSHTSLYLSSFQVNIAWCCFPHNYGNITKEGSDYAFLPHNSAYRHHCTLNSLKNSKCTAPMTNMWTNQDINPVTLSFMRAGSNG